MVGAHGDVKYRLQRKFSSDRTIEEYVRDIWHLKKVKVELPDA